MIENIDATIIAQQPKMRPYIEQMEENIANALGIEKNRVNVKATLEEALVLPVRKKEYLHRQSVRSHQCMSICHQIWQHHRPDAMAVVAAGSVIHYSNS